MDRKRNENEPLVWNQIKPCLKHARKFILACFCCVGIEILLSPAIQSRYTEVGFLEAYLEQNFFQTYREVQNFLDGELYIELDDRLGWRNRANAVSGTIVFDEFGSRSNRGITIENPKPWRVVFLGDSRIYGGNGVENDETINAFLENDEIETLNFGSPDYSLDQSYLSMEGISQSYHPNVFVIGIGSKPGRLLDCHFLPFFDLSILPRLKPRLLWSDHRLVPQIPDYRALLANFPDNQELLDYLKTHDGHYRRFAEFKRRQIWNCTPFLSIFSQLKNRFNETAGLAHTDSMQWENRVLTEEIIKASKMFCDEREIKLVYLVFASRTEIQSGHPVYDEVIQFLRGEGVVFVDTRLLFSQYPGAKDRLFTDDIHCSAEGHRLIAYVLSHMLASSTGF